MNPPPWVFSNRGRKSPQRGLVISILREWEWEWEFTGNGKHAKHTGSSNSSGIQGVAEDDIRNIYGSRVIVSEFQSWC